MYKVYNVKFKNNKHYNYTVQQQNFYNFLLITFFNIYLILMLNYS